MAVINCPKCRKKISDKAKTCQHCGIELNGINEEQLHNIKKVNLIEASQKVNEPFNDCNAVVLWRFSFSLLARN